MSNQFLTEQNFADAFLVLLKNELVMARMVDGQFRDDINDRNDLTINVKRPARFKATTGPALQLQKIVNGSTNIQADNYRGVHVSVSDLEAVQEFNDLVESDTLRSAASELAHTVDSDLMRALLDFPTAVGTPGRAFSGHQDYMRVHTQLMNQAVPDVQLMGVVSPIDGEAIRSSLTVTDINTINRTSLERSRIPIVSQIDTFASNNLITLVAGTRTQTAAVNGANQNVNYVAIKDSNVQTLNVDGLGANATIMRGETFTIAGMFQINPRSREQVLDATGAPIPARFVVMADATANGSGEAALSIATPMVIPTNSGNADTDQINENFQTVAGIPADNAVITFDLAPGGRELIRAAFQRRAIALVSAQLQAPHSGTHSFAQDPETGISIRYWRDSDSNSGEHYHRFDMLYGIKNMQPNLGTRIAGTAV